MAIDQYVRLLGDIVDSLKPANLCLGIQFYRKGTIERVPEAQRCSGYQQHQNRQNKNASCICGGQRVDTVSSSVTILLSRNLEAFEGHSTRLKPRLPQARESSAYSEILMTLTSGMHYRSRLQWHLSSSPRRLVDILARLG